MLELQRTLSAAGLIFLILGAPARAGVLDFVEAETNGDLAGVYDLAVSPDGDHLYAVANQSNALLAFARDGGTGALTWIETEIDGQAGVDGLRRPRQLALSPDGANLYVAALQDDAIGVFARDAGTGALAFVEAVINNSPTVDGIWQVKGVASSAGGGYVFASGRSDPAAPKGALALFARDSGTGELTFVTVLENGIGGVDGLGSGGVVTVSPDGTSVYVASTANAVAVFSFVEATGALAFVEAEFDGVGGVDGLAGASDVTVSADGSHVYVAGANDNAVAVFARDPGTGALAFVGAQQGTPATPGFAGVSAVAVAPSGAYVFTSALTENAAGAFFRDPASGTIQWIAAAVDGQAGVDGLAGARGVAVSPDNGYIYVGGGGDNAIAVFGRGDAFDFGDAPDPTFPTLLASDGARHLLVPALRLGSAIDADLDGAPAAAADGDDLAGLDDEDGVVFTGELVPGQPAQADVTASAAGTLDAWIDFTDDGDWADAGERIASGVALAAGTNPVAFTVPATAVPDSVVVARFRLSTAGVAAPTGAAADGEVEDSVVPIGRGADLGVTPSGTTVADWNQPFTFVFTVASAGPNDVVGATVGITMSSNSGAVTWTCVATNGTCTAAGAGNVADTVDLQAGGSLVYTIQGVVPNEAPGPFISAAAAVAVPAGVTDPVASNDTALHQSLIPSIFLDGFETGDTIRWSSTVP